MTPGNVSPLPLFSSLVKAPEGWRTPRPGGDLNTPSVAERLGLRQRPDCHWCARMDTDLKEIMISCNLARGIPL